MAGQCCVARNSVRPCTKAHWTDKRCHAESGDEPWVAVETHLRTDESQTHELQNASQEENISPTTELTHPPNLSTETVRCVQPRKKGEASNIIQGKQDKEQPTSARSRDVSTNYNPASTCLLLIPVTPRSDSSNVKSHPRVCDSCPFQSPSRHHAELIFLVE
jgi:hypothetical protein